MSNSNETNILFEKQIEEKILERMNRYYHAIKKMKKIIKNGFNSEDDFKKFYELENKIAWDKDFSNVCSYVGNYKKFKDLTTYSFK